MEMYLLLMKMDSLLTCYFMCAKSPFKFYAAYYLRHFHFSLAYFFLLLQLVLGLQNCYSTTNVKQRQKCVAELTFYDLACFSFCCWIIYPNQLTVLFHKKEVHCHLPTILFPDALYLGLVLLVYPVSLIDKTFYFFFLFIVLGLTNLKELQMSCCKITDAGITQLKGTTEWTSFSTYTLIFFLCLNCFLSPTFVTVFQHYPLSLLIAAFIFLIFILCRFIQTCSLELGGLSTYCCLLESYIRFLFSSNLITMEIIVNESHTT